MASHEDSRPGRGRADDLDRRAEEPVPSPANAHRWVLWAVVGAVVVVVAYLFFCWLLLGTGIEGRGGRRAGGPAGGPGLVWAGPPGPAGGVQPAPGPGRQPGQVSPPNRALHRTAARSPRGA